MFYRFQDLTGKNGTPWQPRGNKCRDQLFPSGLQTQIKEVDIHTSELKGMGPAKLGLRPQRGHCLNLAGTSGRHDKGGLGMQKKSWEMQNQPPQSGLLRVEQLTIKKKVSLPSSSLVTYFLLLLESNK